MTIIYHWLFLATSFFYLALLPFDPLPVTWLLKMLPIAVLFFAVFKGFPFSGRILLLLALFFSACGDVLLQFDFFVPGVAAFLVAQLNYGVFFARHWSSAHTRWPISTMAIGYMLVMAFLLTPHLGDLIAPVFAYLVVIGFMGVLATHSTLPIKWAVLGAFVFILSDSFIAIDRFLRPLPFSSYLIMITYYAAQWMIIQGALNKYKQYQA
ncbi:lysoplasmalogenase [Reinekea forsetii]|nr:lysoplasmalogenase [Reinekea forsetii]